MVEGALVNDMIERGSILMQEYSRRFPLLAAFWGRQERDADWEFQLIPDVQRETSTGVHRALAESAIAVHDTDFAVRHAKLLFPWDPEAGAILKAKDMRRNSNGIWLERGTIPGSGYDAAYIYPSTRPATA